MIAEKTPSPGPHLLLLNIGNTNVSMATFTTEGRSDTTRVSVQPIGDVMNAVKQAWQTFPPSAQPAMVASSVCPPVLEELRAACKTEHLEPLLVIGQDLPLPIGVDVPEPAKVGTDRLCNAAGAFAKVKGACAVADLGTAVTIDLVADNGIFLGGTILPGLALSARALHEHTALLPLVDVVATREALGRDTQSAISNGVFAMIVGGLREIVERYATDIGKWPPLILTGGDAPAVAGACDFVDAVIPDLCLEGIAIACQNRAKADDEDPDEA